MKPNTLGQLHDFYQPPAPSWMPQTIGWYIVFGLLALLAVWAAWRLLRRWRHNRYRREALRELEHTDFSGIPVLLKRVALAAWPREQVAPLSGEPWLQFLEAHRGNEAFAKDTGRLLVELDYGGASPAPAEEQAIRQAAGDWIRGHRVRV
jgi:hypothetical protein